MREDNMETRNHIYKFEIDKKETGKYIKSLRKEKGWTAEVLAEKLYCSPKTVSSWETGVRMPSLDMLVPRGIYCNRHRFQNEENAGLQRSSPHGIRLLRSSRRAVCGKHR